MKYILIIFALLFFAVFGCLESSQYRELSPLELISNNSAFDGEKVCIDGIYYNHSISGIMIGRTQSFRGDYQDGTLVNVCGTYKAGKANILEADFVNSTLSIVTDNDIYHLNETLKVHIDFISPDSGKGQVHVSGIKNPFDRLFINETRDVTIEKGRNGLDFEFNLPPCEECSLLSPGIYTVNAAVKIQGKTFEAYKEIMLERVESNPSKEVSSSELISNNDKAGKVNISESNFVNSTLSIFTENDIYHLNETMKVHIDFISPDSGKGQVHVSGIKNPFDRLFINETREVNIEKGRNGLDFEFNLPPCEECSLLSPGIYTVNATVNIHGKTFEAYKEIMLEKAESE